MAKNNYHDLVTIVWLLDCLEGFSMKNTVPLSSHVMSKGQHYILV